MKKVFAILLLAIVIAFGQASFNYSSYKMVWYNPSYEKTHSTFTAFDSACVKLDFSGSNRVFSLINNNGDVNVRLDASALSIYSSGGNTGFNTRSPIGVIHGATSSETNLPISQRHSLSSNALFNAFKICATKSTDMGDGFGAAASFYIEDNAAVKNKIALIGAVRAGADATGDIVFCPGISGTGIVERMRLSSAGKLMTNTTSADAWLDIRGTEGMDGTFQLAADDGDDAADKWQQVVSASTNFWSLQSNGRTYVTIDRVDGEVSFNVDVADIYRGISIGKDYAQAHSLSYAIARANGAYSCDIRYIGNSLFAQSYGVYNNTVKLGNIGLYGDSTMVDGFSFGCGGNEWWSTYSKFSVNKYGNAGIGAFASSKSPTARLEIDGSSTYDLLKLNTAAGANAFLVDDDGLVNVKKSMKIVGATIDSVKYITAATDSVRFYFANGKRCSMRLW